MLVNHFYNISLGLFEEISGGIFVHGLYQPKKTSSSKERSQVNISTCRNRVEHKCLKPPMKPFVKPVSNTSPWLHMAPTIFDSLRLPRSSRSVWLVSLGIAIAFHPISLVEQVEHQHFGPTNHRWPSESSHDVGPSNEPVIWPEPQGTPPSPPSEKATLIGNMLMN